MGDVYIVQPSELTAVTDAIREKGETSAQLVFPGGFVSAIQDISGGGLELNFEILGGTTRPTNPKENTIWVNTSTAITGWVFSAETPENPVSGMVWIYIDTFSPLAFNALKENDIQMYPYGVKQYIGSAWKDQHAEIFQNEEWKEVAVFDGVLYDTGDQKTLITGGWEANASLMIYEETNNLAFTSFETSSMKLTPTSGDGSAIVNTKKKIKIDPTAFSSLNFDVTSGTAKGNDCFGLISTFPANLDTDSIAQVSTSSTGRKTVSLDITGVPAGEYYIACGLHRGSVARTREIYKIWLA